MFTFINTYTHIHIHAQNRIRECKRSTDEWENIKTLAFVNYDIYLLVGLYTALC